MRLIDADKLVEICRKGWRLFGFSDEKICHWVDEYDINAQPTVEAIPVEWLKAYFKKCLSFDDRVFIDNEDSNYDIVIDKYKIFEEWEKENAAEITD